MKTNRRAFLAALLAPLAARFLPKPAATKKLRVELHGFEPTGLRIRYVHHYDPIRDVIQSRVDVIMFQPRMLTIGAFRVEA